MDSRGLIVWKGADFYKWANVMMQSLIVHFHLGPAAEACLVFILYIQGGSSGFGLVVLFPLGFGHVWWLIELENTWLHSARNPWNCQSSFHPSGRVETDSGGQTDDRRGLNTLNWTIPCWQPTEKCWVVNGGVLGNTTLSAFQGFSHSALPLSLQVISHTQVNESLLRPVCLFTLLKLRKTEWKTVVCIGGSTHFSWVFHFILGYCSSSGGKFRK